MVDPLALLGRWFFTMLIRRGCSYDASNFFRGLRDGRVLEYHLDMAAGDFLHFFAVSGKGLCRGRKPIRRFVDTQAEDGFPRWISQRIRLRAGFRPAVWEKLTSSRL